THILAILGDGAAGDVDALLTQDGGDAVVGEGMAGVLGFDQALDAAFEDEQRGFPAARPLHRFGEEVTQLEHALAGVDVLVGYGAAHRRGVHANLLGDLFDHHGFEEVQAEIEEVALALDDGVADAGDGVLALFEVAQELNGAGVALLDVAAGVALIPPPFHLAVLAVEAEVGHAVIVHDDLVLIAALLGAAHPAALGAALDKGDIGLDEAGLGGVEAASGIGIELA